MATAADVERLDKAIALGVLSVRVEGKELVFDDYEGLKRRRDLVAAQVAAASGKRPRRYRRAYYSKGLE